METARASAAILGRAMDGADGELETSGSAEATAAQRLPGASLSVQTEVSWAHGDACGKPTLSEELSSLDVLCDMEFKEDFVKLFKKTLRTLPSVGLPALLAYRPESSRGNRPTQLQAEEDSAPRCEYCGSPLKPFPLFDDVCPLSQEDESKFCCKHNRDLYEFIVNERKKQEAARRVPMALSPHGPHDAAPKRLLSKKRAFQRQQETQMTGQLAFLAAEPTSVAEVLQLRAQKLPSNNNLAKLSPWKVRTARIQVINILPGSDHGFTISYRLSQKPPPRKGWTLEPGEEAAKPEEEEEPISDSVTCCDFTPLAGKMGKNKFLEKYYKHGGKFLTMLPDGTAQLFYPSGNLAIIVVRDKTRLTCIVQEDRPSNPGILAVFKSNGRSTCYYPNGAEWINMNIQGGQYLDQAGSRVKKWMWPNSITTEPQVPLSPIFISLNQHVGVRILGHDKITVSFLAMGQQAKFNVGVEVQASDVSQLPPPAWLGEDEFLLLAFRVRILWLLDRLRGYLNFPSSKQWGKIKPPAYLITRTLKILQLCTAPDISDELRSSVRAIVNTHV